jgi:hypothetical protein
MKLSKAEQAAHDDGQAAYVPRHASRNLGVKNPHAKLNEAAVRDILTSDLTNAQLGRKHKVHPMTITHVRRRSTWKHVRLEHKEKAHD